MNKYLYGVYMNYFYSLVDIATSYGLDGRGSIPDRVRYYSILHSVDTSSGSHLVSYPVDTGHFFPRVKSAGTQS
jgi:hypothetical protein